MLKHYFYNSSHWKLNEVLNNYIKTYLQTITNLQVYLNNWGIGKIYLYWGKWWFIYDKKEETFLYARLGGGGARAVRVVCLPPQEEAPQHEGSLIWLRDVHPRN